MPACSQKRERTALGAELLLRDAAGCQRVLGVASDDVAGPGDRLLQGAEADQPLACRQEIG